VKLNDLTADESCSENCATGSGTSGIAVSSEIESRIIAGLLEENAASITGTAPKEEFDVTDRQVKPRRNVGILYEFQLRPWAELQSQRRS